MEPITNVGIKTERMTGESGCCCSTIWLAPCSRPVNLRRSYVTHPQCVLQYCTHGSMGRWQPIAHGT